VEHIIKVRNPLAHHRAVPENELRRALVLSTDILRAIGRATRAARGAGPVESGL
jgi:hypothetical protein